MNVLKFSSKIKWLFSLLECEDDYGQILDELKKDGITASCKKKECVSDVIAQYNTINKVASKIYADAFGFSRPEKEAGVNFWKLAKDYQEKIKGNFEAYKALKSALIAFEMLNNCEMFDLICEFKELGLCTIEYHTTSF